ncbi:pyridoxal 5'-phosphate synthase glutaminase subunit PdxT [Deinococcus metallilatus]|uniref:Pyridoxal 5'-phosphate synthase subunit PdxT n=1 Tax=Deinococcus metallilatus TaxID=1211322 RepID=A0AAJ5F4Y4_9DEIO|nr:pyridoxal 5'-phosphate synthase glutaminase subunit PdxT [Deinococcus metallilatus]MBB5294100.1 5'-phosphate synthase pdxT subunit [Deinococcus metallilatus]QBY08885.1 pyridoxal 5'-phosphate synthase glutaminase subunit PdxT [Deinococcus metallilatus]RXJ10029.1 pyridoxal 5'-phosphate synthase glutaminase subunit PdxT [Deinococcus metallilatus]TLK28034.1 pyridoxal 5'-phosphate synthase glutaminase subunit PdxT [Deinococcus metallilatus]GMA16564.1 pyridoxal 5'-phosphate synthase subunit PdxT 
MTQPHIGVLALQGAFREHRQRLESLGARVTEVRLPADLAGLQGLVIPGGESTTIARLMADYALWAPVRDFHAAGGALWGTCAGAILLAREVHGAPPQFGGQQDSLALMDLTVRRNAFGRQVDSFHTPLQVQGLDTPFPAVFIRAPVIERVGEGVEVLARHAGQIVLARQGRLLASSFHPELTADARLHALFLDLAAAPLPA